MLKPKTHIVIVLDRSSSMNVIRDEAVAGFNEQIELFKEKSKDHRVRVGLVTFASGVDKPTVWNKMPSSIEPLTVESYKPDGMTAFYDALDFTINELSKLEDVRDQKSSVLVVAITDGHENNSKNVTGEELSAKIKELDSLDNWTFTVMGANINLSELSSKLGIDIGNTMSFNSTSIGTVVANSNINKGLGKYFAARSVGSTKMDGFYLDDEDQSNAPPVVTADLTTESA